MLPLSRAVPGEGGGSERRPRACRQRGEAGCVPGPVLPSSAWTHWPVSGTTTHSGCWAATALRVILPGVQRQGGAEPQGPSPAPPRWAAAGPAGGTRLSPSLLGERGCLRLTLWQVLTLLSLGPVASSPCPALCPALGAALGEAAKPPMATAGAWPVPSSPSPHVTSGLLLPPPWGCWFLIQGLFWLDPALCNVPWSTPKSSPSFDLLEGSPLLQPPAQPLCLGVSCVSFTQHVPSGAPGPQSLFRPQPQLYRVVLSSRGSSPPPGGVRSGSALRLPTFTLSVIGLSPEQPSLCSALSSPQWPSQARLGETPGRDLKGS